MTPALAAALAHEVRRLKTAAGRVRAVPTLVNVGTIAHDRLAFPAAVADLDADPALGTDVLTRALERMGDPVLRSVWLTRGGALSSGEVDLRWRAAAEMAFARHGVVEAAHGACFVVTRHGWLDVGSGERRVWTRMRPAAGRVAALSTTVGPDGSWPVTG